MSRGRAQGTFVDQLYVSLPTGVLKYVPSRSLLLDVCGENQDWANIQSDSSVPWTQQWPGSSETVLTGLSPGSGHYLSSGSDDP